LRSSLCLAAAHHVAAHRNGKAERFNGKSADDERGARRAIGKQDQRRDAEKESGGHHQQSGELHRLFLNRQAIFPAAACGSGGGLLKQKMLIEILVEF
jgi:hypothetical protein